MMGTLRKLVIDSMKYADDEEGSAIWNGENAAYIPRGL